MDFNTEQTDRLQLLFEQNDTDKNGRLNESELRKLLSEFEIDESFAPALMKIFDGSKGEGEEPGVKFEDLTKFFEVLISGNIENFFRLLFNAMDGDRDGGIRINDLVTFSNLVGDALTEEDATEIFNQCANSNSEVKFNDFWKWYIDQHNSNEE